MVEAAVTFLLEKVTEILQYDGDLIAGEEGELEALREELHLLMACLKEMHFKVIEKQMIREVIYDVEDTLDTYLMNQASAAAPKPKTLEALSSSSMAASVESLRETVKSIYEKSTKELDNIKNRGGSGSFGEESWPSVKKDRTIRQDKVVGFYDAEEKIVGYLMEQTRELDVISIIGMPGLGKTTLAWKIYDSPKIQNEFFNRIWVNVSQQMNKKELFLQILKEFTSDDVSNLSDQELVHEVRAFLENEMFLIVFDDVWTVDDWNAIKNVLPMSNWMGKVIITSRFVEVGMKAGIRRPFQLRFLTKDESWKLLQLELFEDVDVCPEELKLVGEQVAHNCNGLPLTIVVIGGILVAQFSRQRPIGVIKNEWLKVSENVIQSIKTDENNHVSNIVGLSYDILPDELRECFLYMGVFPEDHEIPTWILIRLWIAEGFILQKEGQTLEETAEEYLNDLINRNLLMAGRTNSMGEVKTCGVHDAVRAFCISIAGEQNFFQEIKKSNKGFFEPPIQNNLRLCFHSNGLSEFLSEKPKGPSVRSFVCFPEEPVDLEMQYITAIPDAFGLLRVLDSKSIKFGQFPTRLVKLIHLRYVTLRVDDLKILPEPISQLWNLQTLVVETNSRTLEMKANIWRLKWLRHLRTRAAVVLDPNWEGEAGENLHTVSRLSSESCTESVSKRASNIRELGICGDLATLFNNNINKFLENLLNLEKLKLVNDVHYEAAIQKDHCKLIRLPEYNRFPPNLRRLTLTKTSLDWSIMSTTLAKIETLEVLKLKDNAFTGMVWTAVGDGFPRLEFLLIEDADIVIWEASADHFPSLTCLSIKNCRSLKTIPHELAKTNLQKLDIEFLGRSATDSARYIQELKA